jgi:beta-glucosidase
MLQSGQSETVAFTLQSADLLFFDPGRMLWIAEPGSFEVLLGASSRDMRQKATFRLMD